MGNGTVINGSVFVGYVNSHGCHNNSVFHFYIPYLIRRKQFLVHTVSFWIFVQYSISILVIWKRWGNDQMSVNIQNWTIQKKCPRGTMKFDSAKRKDIGTLRTLKIFQDSLTALLTKMAFEEISIRDICTEPMIPRSTFYNYFEDKYDLLNWYLNTIFNDILKSNSGYSFDTLVNGMKLSFAFLEEHAAILQTVLKKNPPEDFLYHSFDIYFFEMMRSSFIRCEHAENLTYSPELTAQLCAAVLRSLFANKLKTLCSGETLSVSEADRFLLNAINYPALGMSLGKPTC